MLTYQTKLRGLCAPTALVHLRRETWLQACHLQRRQTTTKLSHTMLRKSLGMNLTQLRWDSLPRALYPRCRAHSKASHQPYFPVCWDISSEVVCFYQLPYPGNSETFSRGQRTAAITVRCRRWANNFDDFQ
jgi:hypothetical protein